MKNIQILFDFTCGTNASVTFFHSTAKWNSNNIFIAQFKPISRTKQKNKINACNKYNNHFSFTNLRLYEKETARITKTDKVLLHGTNFTLWMSSLDVWPLDSIHHQTIAETENPTKTKRPFHYDTTICWRSRENNDNVRSKAKSQQWTFAYIN